MIVYRLSREKYSNDLSGKGAEIAGGRWNSKGTPLLYTAENRALCTVEIAVHTPLGVLPMDYCVIEIQLPKTKIMSLEVEDLPEDWKTFPHPISTKQIGDDFVKDNTHLVLKTPSAVVEEEYNFLINPFHAQFHKVKIINKKSFQFDKRLFVK